MDMLRIWSVYITRCGSTASVLATVATLELLYEPCLKFLLL
jgi:hypothetical protein